MRDKDGSKGSGCIGSSSISSTASNKSQNQHPTQTKVRYNVLQGYERKKKCNVNLIQVIKLDMFKNKLENSEEKQVDSMQQT